MRALQRVWMAAVAMAATLTTPKMEPGASDQLFTDVLADSWLSAVCRDTSRALSAASRDARVCAWSRRLLAPVAMSSGAHRVRLGAVAGIVAGGTALGLNAMTPGSAGPFTWVVPVAITSIAFLALLAAEPLSRAIAARCR
jgi:hypothetical protein